jgi:hypothetical protein
MSPVFCETRFELKNAPPFNKAGHFFCLWKLRRKNLRGVGPLCTGRSTAVERRIHTQACWPGRNGVAARDALAQIALASHCSEFVSERLALATSRASVKIF